MNDKFWDLKKAKQDKMINGALKIFARNGFRHASTDEIVAEASISKGLLFHYFYSKAGLYAFLTEYSARFAMVELNSELRRREDLPFFDFQYALTKAEALIMRQYPYMLLFMENAGSDIEADTYDLTKEHLSLYRDLSARAGITAGVIVQKDDPDSLPLKRFDKYLSRRDQRAADRADSHNVFAQKRHFAVKMKHDSLFPVQVPHAFHVVIGDFLRGVKLL